MDLISAQAKRLIPKQYKAVVCPKKHSAAFLLITEANMKDIKRGEIYYADLSPVRGSEQGGIRPILILQNDMGNKHSPTSVLSFCPKSLVLWAFSGFLHFQIKFISRHDSFSWRLFCIFQRKMGQSPKSNRSILGYSFIFRSNRSKIAKWQRKSTLASQVRGSMCFLHRIHKVKQ